MKYIQVAFLSLMVSYTILGQNSYSENEHIDNMSPGMYYQQGPGANNTTMSWKYPYGTKLTVKGQIARNFELISHNKDNKGYALRQFSQTTNSWTSWRNLILDDGNGNLGIGTTSPNEKLHVYNGDMMISSVTNTNNTAHKGIHFTTDNTGYYSSINTYRGTASTAIGLQFQTMNGTTTPINALNINPNGNVGIGTTSPIEKLHLKGNLYVDSGINDNKIYWNGHNMTMGTRPGAYSHNIFHLKPGGASQGMLFSKFNMYNAGSQSEHELKIQFHSNGNSFINSGNVGIGTTNPASKLEVNGDISLVRSKKIKFLETVGGGDRAYIKSTNGENGDYNSLIFAVGDGSQSMFINYNGNVGIGTNDTKGFKLGVNGDIAATKVKVALYNNWPDYVFEEAYELPTLKEVENHINEKGHLQNVPSAKEVAENGFFLEEMNAKLLQKIEELTLYTIAQEKKIVEQDEKLELLIKRLEKLESK